MIARCFILSVFTLVFWGNIYSQTNLSGIVNSYFEVTNISYGNPQVTVSSSTGISAGDTLMLLQMKGAVIDVQNTDSYGDVSIYNGAGEFELVEVCEVNGNTVTFKKNIENFYFPNGRLQLVKFPNHSSINVSGQINATPWNGSTGGVVILRADNEITLNATIDVSGNGFRGGNHINSPFSCNFFFTNDSYEYQAASGQGASKGEGIAEFTNLDGGRGAMANGGGGGNDHNSGGGGGSNISTGGSGGINDEPGTFNCQGDFPGKGGKPLTSDNLRVFLGGGGGAGHSNSNFVNTGGNGGGIVILIADEIIGNNEEILANGTDGLRGFGDGGSGGGAGGSILLFSDLITGNLTTEAHGGKGGNGNGAWLEDDGITVHDTPANKCMGPGGGGGGGTVWFKSTSAPSNVITDILPGLNGIVTNSQTSSCVGSANGAQPGFPGVIQLALDIRRGNKLNKSCASNPVLALGPDTTLCNSATHTLSTNISGNYAWSTGENTQSIQVTTTGIYTLIVEIDDCIICDTIVINASEIQLNFPATQALCDQNDLTLDAGPDGISYMWSTGENSQAITVSTSGIYHVTVTDGICTETDSTEVLVLQQPQGLEDSETLCDFNGVTLSAENPGASYNWSTGETTQSISVNELGIYSVDISYGLSCEITEEIEVVPCENELFVPNTFTPNGDGANDTWLINGLFNYPENSVTVFNRNGSKVFEATNYDGSWTGGSLPSAAYFYVLDLNNSGNKLRGSVTIVRN